MSSDRWPLPDTRLASMPAKHESAFDLRGTPVRGRQNSRRRGEDTPKAPRALADPLAPSSKLPSRRSTKGRCDLDGALNAARGGKSQEIADQTLVATRDTGATKRSRNHRVSPVIPAKEKERAKGLEPSTSSLGSRDGVVLSPVAPALTTRRRKRCTNGCTSSRGAPASGSPAADGAETGQPSLRNGLDQLPAVVEELSLRLAALPPEVLAVLQTLFTGLPKRP